MNVLEKELKLQRKNVFRLVENLFLMIKRKMVKKLKKIDNEKQLSLKDVVKLFKENDYVKIGYVDWIKRVYLS